MFSTLSEKFMSVVQIFSHSVFYPFREISDFFFPPPNLNSHLQFLRFWKSLKFVVWERVIVVESKRWKNWFNMKKMIANIFFLLLLFWTQSRHKLARLGGSVVSVSDSWPGGYEFDPQLRRLFFPAYFRLSPLQKCVRKVVGGFGKKSWISTGVGKPGNTYASPTAMIWP